MNYRKRKDPSYYLNGINFAGDCTRSLKSYSHNLLLRMPAQMYRWFSTSATALSKAVALKSERRFNLYRSLNSVLRLIRLLHPVSSHRRRCSRIMVYVHTHVFTMHCHVNTRWMRHAGSKFRSWSIFHGLLNVGSRERAFHIFFTRDGKNLTFLPPPFCSLFISLSL